MATPTTLPATFVAGNVLTAAQQNALRGAFRVLQVVTTTKTDFFTTTSGSLVDITNFNVSITPSSSSSKILVLANWLCGVSTDTLIGFTLFRGSTAINQSTGGSTNFSNINYSASANYVMNQSLNFLDSPATTSATTYKLQMSTGAGTATFNRTGGSVLNGGASNITVMEISA